MTEARRLVEGRTDVQVVKVAPPSLARTLVLARQAAPQRPAVELVYQLLVAGTTRAPG